MQDRKPNVLLLGENPQGSSYLVSRLEGHGCACRFAASYQEACLLLRKERFDLVLSPIRLCSGSVFPLIDVLEGSSTTMFYSHAVEDSCWWLPALRNGEKCFGSPALRPSEFIGLLDRIIGEIRSGASASPASGLPLPDRVAAVAAVAPSAPDAEPPTAKPARSKDGNHLRRKAAG
jgi:hypothetical protein